MHSNQTAELRQAVIAFSTASGEAISTEIESKSALLVSWVQYLCSYHMTDVADELLLAVAPSIREAAGTLSLGLVRPTLFSFRSQIDLMLAWLYFKDHAIEWGHVNQTADGFKLKKEIIQYLETHNPRFGSRFSTLRDIATRKEAEPYRLLSAHIHSQSNPVLPQLINLKEMVMPMDRCSECAAVAFEVSEYLNDILLSIHAPIWHSLPAQIQTSADSRFQSPGQKTAFFA
jgi:hypothetical protein